MSQQVVGAGSLETCPPWRWLRTRLRTCVARLRAPLDFAPIGCGDEHPPRPEVMAHPGARPSTGASAAADRARDGSMCRDVAALRLHSGQSVRIRPVRPADAAAVQDFVRRLSDASRRQRFFAPIRELAPATLARLAGSADRCGPALLAETHDGEARCVVALAQCAAGDDAGTCELALVVADAWQRLGLGRALMGILIQRARDARRMRVVADVLRDNGAMLALGRAHDFAVAGSPHGSTMVRLERDLGIDRGGILPGRMARPVPTAAFAAS